MNNEYDVIILGGGVAGLSCALVLGSAEGNKWFNNRRILVLDDNRSDARSAIFNNAAGLQAGTLGEDALVQLHGQLAQYTSVTHKRIHVQDVEMHESGNASASYEIVTPEQTFHTACLVLATGFHQFAFTKLPIEIEDNAKAMKPNKIQLKNTDTFIREGLYVVGTLAGVPSQFASAAGSGSDAACALLSLWAERSVVIHDKLRINKQVANVAELQ